MNHVRQAISVPGLIGDGCKYSTYHRCMIDFNHELNQ